MSVQDALANDQADHMHIAVISICPDVVAEPGQTTLSVIRSILQSRSVFAGLRQVVPDDEALSTTLSHWIAEARIDTILVVDECATSSFRKLENEERVAFINDPALGRIGIVDIRARHEHSSIPWADANARHALKLTLQATREYRLPPSPRRA